jgi:hypothetical protein
MRLNLYGGLLLVIEIFSKIPLACSRQSLATKKRGLSKKHLKANGRVRRRMAAKSKNAYLHVGIKLRKGRKIGVPDHIIVSILIEMVLKRIAEISPMYTWTLVSYPNKQKPIKKYPMRKVEKLGARAQMTKEMIDRTSTIKRMDLHRSNRYLRPMNPEI